MKKPLLFLALLAAGSWSNAAPIGASISYTNSASAATTNGANIALNKFDTTLGTLTDVIVTVNFLSLGGSFSVTSPTATPTSVLASPAPGGRPRLIDPSVGGTLGFTNFNASGTTIYPVATTPSLPPNFAVPGNSTQVFTITSTNVLANSIQNINSSFWSAYQSVGGVGSVVFQVLQAPRIVTSGSLNASAFLATADMTVTYNYNPAVPEPGTWAVGALLLGGAVYTFWRRRQNVAVETATAA